MKYGVSPESIEIDSVRNAFLHWKKKYVTSNGCPKNSRRVLWDDMKSTVSEGIGYGMLIAVYFNDKSLHDDLYRYYKSFSNMHGLMNWKITEKGAVEGQNAATDAEEDVAFALIMAHEQWGSIKGKGNVNYRKEARSMLYKILDYEVESSTYVLKPGDMWGGTATTNPSYFAPAYYRVFQQFSGDKRWTKVLDKSYEILAKCTDTSTGLVPDWCNAEGGPAAGVGWARENGIAYLYDAARTPWRIGLDYLWFGESRSQQYCQKVTKFVQKIKIQRVRDGYYVNGKRIGTNHNSTFIGPFSVAAMAGTTDTNFVNAACYENQVIFNNTYFNDCLRVLTLLAQSGNFYLPESYY